MKRLSHLLLTAFLLGVSFFASAKNGAELDCQIGTTAQELIQLHRAPHGAKRIGKHTLAIRWQAGQRKFKDQPPYDEPMGGVRWEYCGYNAAVKKHLLQKWDGSVLSGVMLDDATGAVLPAGESVLFSPDFQYYLAYEQEDGRDGATLKLYRRDGSPEWDAYSGILTPDRSTILATFENTHWNDNGQLQTSATCVGAAKASTLKLTRVSGQWQWLPRIRCPAQ